MFDVLVTLDRMEGESGWKSAMHQAVFADLGHSLSELNGMASLEPIAGLKHFLILLRQAF